MNKKQIDYNKELTNQIIVWLNNWDGVDIDESSLKYIAKNILSDWLFDATPTWDDGKGCYVCEHYTWHLSYYLDTLNYEDLKAQYIII